MDFAKAGENSISIPGDQVISDREAWKRPLISHGTRMGEYAILVTGNQELSDRTLEGHTCRAANLPI